MLNHSLVVAAALALAVSPAAFSQDREFSPYHNAPEPLQQYTVTNLVSNLPGVAAVTDPNLANAWGLSRTSNGDWWISDNTSGLSTLYSGTTGAITPLVVTIPPSEPGANSAGSPTGTIFNGTTDFEVAPGKAAIFLFATEDGTISGWNPGANPTRAIIAVNEKQASVFKGMSMAQTSISGEPLANYLYVADFRKGKVAVFDAKFHHAWAIESEFAKCQFDQGFAPFNVQYLGGSVYVAYAKQDAAKHDEVDGPGLGFVAVYTPRGRLVQVLQHGKWFNGPWGIAIAPSDFGAYSHDVLVGNFGSGEIAAFEPATGSYRGTLRDAKNNPIVIQGLWGLSFGGGTAANGSATSLYFGAGPDSEANGLFGTLTAIQNTAGNDQ
jgi:uncharacterized protein (TIGR03118 family)